jgi:hypothetical protein
MTGRTPCDGCLTPWADPVTGTLGWQVHTASRHLAVALAGKSRAVQPNSKREWQAQIRQSALAVTVTAADDSALWCRLGSRPDSGVLTVTFTPWAAGTIVKCPPQALPACGTLSVREVQMTTRMGRVVRYLVPEFHPS